MAKNVGRNRNHRITAGTRWNRWFILLLVLGLAVAGVGSYAYASRSNLSGSAVVATVNGEPVTYDEFKQGLASNRAKVSSYYQSKYKADSGDTFWTTNFNGEVPLNMLKKDALSTIVDVKIPQILAKEKGIVTDISYSAFLKELATENQKRAAAAKNNQVVFGPMHYSEAEYYRQVNSNLVGKLRDLYQKNTQVSDQELKQYYETNKQLYKEQDDIDIEKISATGADAENIMKAIRIDLDNGTDLREAAAKYKGQVEISDQVFNAQTAHSDSLAYPQLYAKVLALQPRQRTDIIQEGGKYLIAECIHRKVAGYQSFEEVKEAIRSHLAGEAYDRAVDAMKRSAKVVVNDRVYNRIGAEVVVGQ